jgi:hypothetical protein
MSLVVALVAAGASAGVSVAGPAAAAAEVPICEQVLPAATIGAITLDTPTVQAGTRALGILTGITPWPANMIGGGSGETFLSCTPWTPLGQAEVMPSPGAGVFRVDVPAGTPAGSYPVSVVYYEGSVRPNRDGTLVRLSTTLTVSADPVADPSTGAACALTGEPASTGQLVVGDTVPAGGVVRLALDGFDGEGWILNEYDVILFLACLDGAAAPVPAYLPTTPFDLPVPASATPGSHVVRVWGVVAGEVVWWERPVTVTAAPAPVVRELASTGTSTGPAVMLGAALVAAGLRLVRVGRGRVVASAPGDAR